MRRSFEFSGDVVAKLKAIRETAQLKNDATTVRLCIDLAYQQLIEGEVDTGALLRENNLLLRAILIETLKTGFDPDRALSPEARAYLQQLGTELR